VDYDAGSAESGHGVVACPYSNAEDGLGERGAVPLSPRRSRMGYRDSRVARMMRQPAFPVALAALAVVLLGWPVLRPTPLSPRFAYTFVLVVWAVVILALFLMSRSDGSRPPVSDPGDPRSSVDD
jgi:hypothetical protein